MKFVLFLLVLFSLLIGFSMNNKDTLGSRIGENILKMRSQEAMAASHYRAAVMLEPTREELLDKQALSMMNAIPAQCRQSLSLWHTSVATDDLSKATLKTAWSTAQQYCRDMPDFHW